MSVVIKVFSWYTSVDWHSCVLRADTWMLILLLVFGLWIDCFVLFCSLCPPPPPPFSLTLMKLLLVPRVVAVSPQMRLVEDNPSSLSLVEIYKQRCAKKGIEHDNPISRYYDRLATVQARGTQASHQVLEYIMNFNQGLLLRTLWYCAQSAPALTLHLSLDIFCRGCVLIFWGVILFLLYAFPRIHYSLVF